MIGHRRMVSAMAVFVTFGVTALVLWALATWALGLVPAGLDTSSLARPVSSEDRLAVSLAVLQAESSLRSAVVTLTGSLLSACIFAAGLFWTGRTFLLSRSSQNSERFGRGVELIANPDSIPQRVAGILSLRRLAEESALDRRLIVDYLASFVRAHAKRGPLVGVRLPEDVTQAVEVLLVLSSDVSFRRVRVDLRGCFLPGVDVSRRRLENLLLDEVDLRGAVLHQSDFRRCSIVGANFDGTVVTGADLRGADGLSQGQLDMAIGDATTRIEDHLHRPNTWGS